MLMTIFTMLGASFTLVLLLMVCLWVAYLFQRNASIVDIGWGIGFILAAWSYFFLGYGNFWKGLVLSTMVTIWAARLTYHLFSRYQSNVEDLRYSRLRSNWQGISSNAFFFVLFIFQGVLIVIISLPFFIVGLHSTSFWSVWEMWGIILWLIGVAGETWADAQLAAFRKNPDNKDKVFKKGWWRFSRHPNYFFEIVTWIGFSLFALPTQGGWIGILAPVLVAILIFKVSGIPLNEEAALASKGDEYRKYQDTTSVFFPWFPRD